MSANKSGQWRPAIQRAAHKTARAIEDVESSIPAVAASRPAIDIFHSLATAHVRYNRQIPTLLWLTTDDI